MSLIGITCESCGAQFRLDSEKLTKPRNKVRCSQCKHIFFVDQPDEDSLIHIEISDEDDSFIPGALSQQGIGMAPAVPPKKGFAARKALIIALPLLLVLLIALYFSFGGSFLGSSSNDASHHEAAQPTVTIMDTLQAFYLENIHAGQVLVIEGEVLNESPQPVSFILMEGKLYGTEDKVAQVQRCYTGNPLTRKEIAHLKPSEIQDRMMNREGKNLKNVRIPPGARVSFTLVFHNLPEISSLGNYSVDVISSKFD